MDPISVCAVSQSFYPYMGGLTRYVNALAKYLMKMGNEFRIIHFKTDTIPPIDFSEGIELLRVNIGKLGKDKIANYMRFKEIIIEATHGSKNATELYEKRFELGFNDYLDVNKRVASEIKDVYDHKPFDILHIHDFQILPVRVFLDKTFDKIPVIFTWHIPFTGRIEPAWKDFLRDYMSKYDKIVLSTEEYVKAAESAGIVKSKLVKINPFIDPEEYRYEGENDVRQKFGIGNSLMLLCVSRMDPRKGQDVLINAVKKVFDARPEFRNKIKCVFVGNGSFSKELMNKERSGLQEKFRELAVSLGVNGNVIFTGHVPDNDLNKFYDACDIVVQPSRQEGFGLTVSEGMLFGKPVIGSEVGGIPEQIKDGVNGFLFTAGDSQQLAEALIKLIDDENLRKSMGENGKTFAANMFTVERGYNDHIKLYGGVLADFRKRFPED
ncbi:MAG: glycosyltransferase family 4 protein [Candidatus Aenigmarchaeota archaeon]|nr:glycosyltransferase family 4 protein [Candidatus Aenigmarchaeota archaeon]